VLFLDFSTSSDVMAYMVHRRELTRVSSSSPPNTTFVRSAAISHNVSVTSSIDALSSASVPYKLNLVARYRDIACAWTISLPSTSSVGIWPKGKRWAEKEKKISFYSVVWEKYIYNARKTLLGDQVQVVRRRTV